RALRSSPTRRSSDLGRGRGNVQDQPVAALQDPVAIPLQLLDHGIHPAWGNVQEVGELQPGGTPAQGGEEGGGLGILIVPLRLDGDRKSTRLNSSHVK